MNIKNKNYIKYYKSIDKILKIMLYFYYVDRTSDNLRARGHFKIKEILLEKTFRTIDEQIEILKLRNIDINNYNEAYKILSKNNYYYLINGYKDLFLDTTSKEEKYINNTKLEEIYALYEFDKNIKINFLKYLLLIENEVDTYIAYEFSKSYGHKDYLILKNFNDSNSKKSLIEKFIKDVNLEIQYQYKNSNEMIAHYLNNYKYVPLWVLVRVLSFGKISRFYSLMKPKEQNAISKKYNLRINDFSLILHNLTLARNICAHDEKLYDLKMKNRISSTIYHEKMKIENKNGNYQYATRDLFSIVITLKMLLEAEQFSLFYNEIIKNIRMLEEKLSAISIDKVLYKMGFPKNYKKMLKL